MKIYREIEDLADFESWGGGVDTAEKICDADMGEAFITELSTFYPDGLSTVALNDLLWFDSEFCLNIVGLTEDDEDDEEE